MAVMTTALRNTKGATYAAAVNAMVAALVDLASCEQLLDGNACNMSGKFPALGGFLDLKHLEHPTYLPVASTKSIADLVHAQIQVLINS